MSRTRLASCCVLLGACALLFGQGAQAAAPTLYAHYTANCTFSFVDDSSSPVTTVPPGQYQIAVDTPYAFGNGGAACDYVQFHMSGPGVDISTTLSFGDSVQELFTVTLAPSSTYVAAETGKNPFQRSFTVAATGTAVGTAGGSSSSGSGSTGTKSGSSSGGSTSPIGTPLVTTPFRGSLVGAVSAAGKLTLKQGGKAVTSLKPGRYSLQVTDSSRKAGFIVQEVRKGAKTVSGVTAVGKHSATVVLKSGQWFFYGTFVGEEVLLHRPPLAREPKNRRSAWGREYTGIMAGSLGNRLGSTFLRLLALVGASAAVALGVGSAQAAHSTSITPTIYFAYSMDCTFSIVDDSGKPVTSVAPGNYQIDVTTPIAFGTIPKNYSDMTACKGMAQFQLSGPGVSFFTTLTAGCEAEYVTTQTFLPSSTYTAVDQNQPSVARASFTTLATGTPTKVNATYGGTSTGKGTTSTDIVGSGLPTVSGTLVGKLSASGVPTLMSHGKAVTKLVAGRYRFQLTDQDKHGGFSILGPKTRATKNLTGVKFVGRKSPVVVLTPGRWTFLSGLAQIRTFVVN